MKYYWMVKNSYDIETESENGKINYMIVSKDDVKSSGNKGCQCKIICDNKNKI